MNRMSCSTHYSSFHQLTSAKRPAFSTNHLADTNKTTHIYKQVKN